MQPDALDPADADKGQSVAVLQPPELPFNRYRSVAAAVPISRLITLMVCEHPSFEEWWEPFTLGVGPAGDYAAGLEARRQAQLRERCRELLPAAPFVLTARAWAARGLV